MLLLPNVLPGSLSGVPYKHADAVCYDCEGWGICYDFGIYIFAQGANKWGLGFLEVQGAEKLMVGWPWWREVALIVRDVEPGRPVLEAVGPSG